LLVELLARHTMGQADRALRLCEQAIDLLQPTGSRIRTARAHSALGTVLADVDAPQATAHRQQALSSVAEMGVGADGPIPVEVWLQPM
jgi:hypothetical protein